MMCAVGCCRMLSVWWDDGPQERWIFPAILESYLNSTWENYVFWVVKYSVGEITLNISQMCIKSFPPTITLHYFPEPRYQPEHVCFFNCENYTSKYLRYQSNIIIDINGCMLYSWKLEQICWRLPSYYPPITLLCHP